MSQSNQTEEPKLPIGDYANLIATRRAPPGMYLTDGTNEVLLPNKLVPRELMPGDELRVFVYTDSEDRPVATTQIPLAKVGEFANMRCAGVSPHGAFMNWGLDKDLFVPFAESGVPMRPGDSAVVRVVLDKLSGRLFGSTKLSKFLSGPPSSLKVGDKVECLVYRRLPNGMKVIINNSVDGTIFADELHEPLKPGDRRSGYVKNIRPDGKVSITLQIEGYRAALSEAPSILDRLDSGGGFLPYNDDSEPGEIRRVFGMSKGTFKKAIGKLFREGLIEITDDGIRRVRRRS